MQRSADLVTRVSEKLLRWRWFIMALIGIFNIAVESAERWSSTIVIPDPYYLWEALLFGFVGPMLGGIGLTWLARARERQRRADHHLSLHRELLALLGEVQDWDELISLVVRFPRRVVDLRAAGLLVRDQAHDGHRLEAQWWDPSDESLAGPALLGEASICSDCATMETAPSDRTFPVRCTEDNDPRLGDRYCLPLVYGGQLIALLYLYLPTGVSPAQDEASALSAMAASMAIALHDAQPQRSAIIQAEAAHAERRRIARDLHDTLGQTLGYLNLKLDQLAQKDDSGTMADIRAELEQMCAVAGEAYRQVRTTLSDLQPPTPPDIETALQQEAELVAGRAGFELKVVSDGLPHPLPPHVRRQLLYLLGEALTNVERHAGARHVELHLAWTQDRLVIRLLDDGCGFDVGAAQSPGHFGLGTMQQRALAVDGEFGIVSSPGSGTEVSLSLPIIARRTAPGELP
jgi:signal transduction histidine kinase